MNKVRDSVCLATDVDKDASEIKLSIVLPVLNEETNLETLHEEISNVVSELACSYEVIFVDDGSTDNTFEKLKNIRERDDHVKIIQFRRNFGQTAAMAAGFDHARGEIIVTMDADRQNDPRDIPKLLDKINEGFDVVSGWRFHRKDGFFRRKLPSIIANKLISLTTDVSLHDYGCTLKAFKRNVVKNIELYGEMHRFIPAIASWMGVSIAEIRVNHRPRVSGTSKYGISRTMRVALDLITVKFLLSYSSRPLQFFGSFGLLATILGFALALYLAVQRLYFDVELADRPLLLLAVLLIFMGLQFITVGLLAELQTRTYHEAQNKRTYVVRQIIE
ncbi:MAG: glycosyltransferase family 2 protein [Gammaproteobacteria bacterium]|nr:glycosyltransferase family 2 protein [Gammaproteobacteria bacterium]